MCMCSVAEFNRPDSVLSRYVPPIAQPNNEDSEEELFNSINNSINNANNSSNEAQMKGIENALVSYNNGRQSLTTPRPKKNLSSEGRKGQSLLSPNAANSLSSALVPSSSSSPSPFSASSSLPYHSPLQRSLHRLFPQYTEGQLSLHSKFTPSFYLAPQCKSLEEERNKPGLIAGNAKTTSGGTAIGGAKGGASSSSSGSNQWIQAAGAEQPAPYQIGSSPLAPLSSSLTSVYSSLPPLDSSQRSLLQSVFDRVDDSYPLPGSAPKEKMGVKETIEEINRKGRANRVLTAQEQNRAQLEREAAAMIAANSSNSASSSAAAANVKRQLVAREGTGGSAPAVYDVFNLPYGFKVVRDDTIDPRIWQASLSGGAEAAAIAAKKTEETLAKAAAEDMNSTATPSHKKGSSASAASNASSSSAPSDPGLKDRLRGVLDGLASKYGLNSGGGAGEGKDQQPANAAQMQAMMQAARAAAAANGRSNSSAFNSATNNNASRPSTSPSPPPSSSSASGAFSPRAQTPGASMEVLNLPSSNSSPINGRQVAASSLADLNEVVTIDYDKAEEENKKKKRKGKKGTAASQVIVGKPPKSKRIVPSRGTQLMSRLTSSVRCCCLVPSTHTVWTAQRDAVIVLRDRSSGKVTNRIDAPSLIWCMLLVDSVLWLGTETGMLLAYNVHTHKRLKQSINHSGGIHCLTRGVVTKDNPQSNLVFSGSNDFTMCSWSLSMDVRTHYTGHAGGVRCILALSPGRVWTGGDDGVIRVWDVASGTSVEELVRHTGSVLSLLSTGDAIWSCSEDGTLCSWSLSSPIRCIKQLSTGSNDRIAHLLLCGQQVWSCGQDRRIHIWDASSMDWLGKLDGHLRYVSGLIKVHQMETRMVWSYGLGEEEILVWRSEMVTDTDAHERYVSLLAQLTTQTDELGSLRARVELAEFTARHTEEQRAAEKDFFAKQLDEILLQLAQALAGKEGFLSTIDSLNKNLADLSRQNYLLRNELRIHLEKLTSSELVIHDVLSRVETKAEHIERLEADSLAQRSKFDAALKNLQREYERLTHDHAHKHSTLDEKEQELISLRSKVLELDGAHHQRVEGLAFYSSENARLRKELEVQTAFIDRMEKSNVQLYANYQAKQLLVEKQMLEQSIEAQVAAQEGERLRAEVESIKTITMQYKAEKEEWKNKYEQLQKTQEQERNEQAAKDAFSSQLLHSHSRRIASLESSLRRNQDELNELQSAMDRVARGMSGVEKRTKDLTRRDNEIYSVRSKPNFTFQQAANERMGLGVAPTPSHSAVTPSSIAREGTPSSPTLFATPALFSELHSLHSLLSLLMQNCLSQKQKLHVGYAFVSARGTTNEGNDEAKRMWNEVQRETNNNTNNSAAMIKGAASTPTARKSILTPSSASSRRNTSKIASSSRHSISSGGVKFDAPLSARAAPTLTPAAQSHSARARVTIRTVSSDEDEEEEDEEDESEGEINDGEQTFSNDPSDSPVQSVLLNPPPLAHSTAATEASAPHLSVDVSSSSPDVATHSSSVLLSAQRSSSLQQAQREEKEQTHAQDQHNFHVALEPFDPDAALAFQSPTSAAAAVNSRGTSSSSASSSAAAASHPLPPLISYDLSSLSPPPSPPTSVAASVAFQRQQDRAKEQRLMRLDGERHRRKMESNREKERRN